MDFMYQFFDQGALDPLWRFSWKEYLLHWGGTRWARAEMTDDGNYSLRSMVAHFVEPEPDADEVGRILAHETIQSTVRRSSPQFGAISELIYNTPGLRRHALVMFGDEGYLTALMAAAAEAWLRGRIPVATLWVVFKLHSTNDPAEWLELSRRNNKALKAALSGREMFKPIYRWQGPGFLNGEEWANCLGVPDTRRFIGFLSRAWKENWPVPHLKNSPETETPIPAPGPPRFRDCTRDVMTGREIRKVADFGRPCVYFEWQ